MIGFQQGGALTHTPLPIVYERADPLRWDYRVVAVHVPEEPLLDEQRLSALGAEGWLLAGIVESRNVLPVVTYYFVQVRI